MKDWSITTNNKILALWFSRDRWWEIIDGDKVYTWIGILDRIVDDKFRSINFVFIWFVIHIAWKTEE